MDAILLSLVSFKGVASKNQNRTISKYLKKTLIEFIILHKQLHILDEGGCGNRWLKAGKQRPTLSVATFYLFDACFLQNIRNLQDFNTHSDLYILLIYIHT